MLNLAYSESLKILQNTGRIVELMVSQILKQPTKKFTTESFNVSSKENSKTMNKLRGKSFQRQQNSLTARSDSDLKLKNVDYLKHIRYETEEITLQNEEKHFVMDECSLIETNDSVIEMNTTGLVSAKSMPNLPKVSIYYQRRINLKKYIF